MKIKKSLRNLTAALGLRTGLHTVTAFGSPLSTTAKTSPASSIALQDLPERTGKWMVIGRVVDDPDLAKTISTAPLERPRYVKPNGYQPKLPIVIESMTKDCR